MWLPIKLIITLGVFLYRIGSRQSASFAIGDTKTVDGVAFTVSQHKKSERENHRVTATLFGTDFDCRSFFKLSRETELDRYFKSLGLAKEIQTGDDDFDRHIYIASDSSAFADEITGDRKSRDLILELFQKDCTQIWCNGKSLWFRFNDDKLEDDALIKVCIALLRQLSDMEKNWKGHFADPFLWKSLAIEGVVWSLAVYSVLGVFERWVNTVDYHLSTRSVISQGVYWSLFGFLGLLALIVLTMRGSSRGHRIIVESAVVLAIAFPLGGTILVSDINREFDKGPSVFKQRVVEGKESRVHYRRRSKYYTQHLYLDPVSNAGPSDPPGEIEVSNDVYSKADRGDLVTIEIGNGALGLPWYRGFKFEKKPQYQTF